MNYSEINQLFKWLLIVCFSTIIPVNKINSQVYSASDWQEIGEQMVEDEEDNVQSWNSQSEDLEELKEHPLNINVITKEQLERFPFLTDLQIEYLLYYLYLAGPMETVYELQLVEDMDRQTIQFLIPFIYAGKVEKPDRYPTFKEIMNSGKNECLIRLDLPLNKKDGYRTYPDSVLLQNPNKRYLGKAFYHSIKYGFHYKDQVYWGLNAEKDAGEPFFAGKNKKGYDFYSFYLFLRNLGKLKALAVGNYRVSFGLGLVLNTDYNLGKSSSIATIQSRQGGIKKHSSTGESDYFQGIAGSYQLGKFVVSGFYSYKKLDAIVENGFITSIKKDGLHRTVNDFEKKNKAVNQIVGANVTTSLKDFRLGMTVVYNFFNRMLKPDLKPYSVFYPAGRNFFNLGIDYTFRRNKLKFSGETAIDKGGRVATLNMLRFSPLSGYQVVLLQRYYPKDYQSLLARSVSENSMVRNESGIYFALEAKPVKYWNLFAYIDFFRFPWLKYDTDRPSSGFDAMFQATYSPFKNISMYGRYRYKKKDKNYREESSNLQVVLPFSQHKFRYQLGITLQEKFSLRTTADYVRIRPQGKSHTSGFMLSQSVAYSFQQLPLQLAVNYGIFATDDYSSRITIYEKSILYAFSLPVFYGKGMRFALNARYDFNRKLTAFLKFAHTGYADRKASGSGLERIEGNGKTDIYLQVRWKFPWKKDNRQF